MKTSTPCMIYCTTADRDEADMIGRTLVTERLAACANIIDGMAAYYWWEGALQQGKEAILLLKTTEAKSSDLIERLVALHSYDCPCALILPVAGGNPDYLAWIQGEIKDAVQGRADG